MSLTTPPKIGPYEFKGEIGTGAFSCVKLVQNMDTNDFFACKVISKEKLSTPKRMERFEDEIRIQQQLRHPNVVRIYDLLKDTQNYYIIMEFCQGGELFQYIVDKGKLTEDETKPILDQVLEAVKYIHKMGVVHRDIKPENILIDQNGKVKLSDFGLSKFVSMKSNLVKTPCGSPCYASPECLSGLPYNGYISDMWSVGVLFYACVCGQLPWTKRSQAELYAQVKAGKYEVPQTLTPECQDLITKLMDTDTNTRITPDDALKHEWFDSLLPQVRLDREVHMPDLSIRKIDDFFQKYQISQMNLIVQPSKSSETLVYQKIVTQIEPQRFGSPIKIPETTRTNKLPALAARPRPRKDTGQCIKPVQAFARASNGRKLGMTNRPQRSSCIFPNY